MKRGIVTAGLWVAMAAGVLAGCAQMERFYPNMYAALQAREQLRHPPPPGQRIETPLGYRQYQTQRRRLFEDGARPPD
ncbi:MAG: hypothetical protein P8180_09220 [Gammaproteobacteria bacterium]|jgi:hypothetical protein